MLQFDQRPRCIPILDIDLITISDSYDVLSGRLNLDTFELFNRELSRPFNLVDPGGCDLVERCRLRDDCPGGKRNAFLDGIFLNPALAEQIIEIAHHFLLRETVTGLELLANVTYLDRIPFLAPRARGSLVSVVEVLEHDRPNLVV